MWRNLLSFVLCLYSVSLKIVLYMSVPSLFSVSEHFCPFSINCSWKAYFICLSLLCSVPLKIITMINISVCAQGFLHLYNLCYSFNPSFVTVTCNVHLLLLQIFFKNKFVNWSTTMLILTYWHQMIILISNRKRKVSHSLA